MTNNLEKVPSAYEERLRHVSLKVKRAYDHLEDLKRHLDIFFESKPYKVGMRHDLKSRKLIYYLKRTEPLPDCIPLIVGDVIQNLVSALDHLAYQIVCKDTSDNPPQPKKVYFPIAENASDYEAIKNRKLIGAKQQSIDAVDAVKPYKGGNDQLWMLHQLNNIDKHRLLLTYGAQAGGLNVWQLLASEWNSHFLGEEINALNFEPTFLVPSDTGFPLTQGFELYIGGVDEKPDPQQQFLFEVVINEPGIVERQPISETLHQFARAVDETVVILARLLK